jgi:transcriptional regulator with XRE-family HTH domain
MGDVSNGRVYVGFDCGWLDADSDEEPRPFWHGQCELDGQDAPENGPEFLDASDAVRWWQDRGAKWILVNMGDGSFAWTGENVPDDVPGENRRGVRVDLFSHEDPRGRAEAALVLSKASRLRTRESFARQRMDMAVRLGQDLRRRRERVGVSMDELASRIDVAPSWVADVESGRTAFEVSHKQWDDIVWATREPWPDPRRTEPKPNDGKVRRYSWQGGIDAGLTLAEDAVRRWLEDDYS